MTASLLCLAALSVLAVEKGSVNFQPTAAEVEVPERFRMVAAKFDFEMEQIRDTPNYTVASVRFPSPLVTPDPENNVVHAEYFRPKGGGKRPAVVVLHILGADFALSRYFAARLADEGVAAIFVKLPYYGERRPKGGSKRFLSSDIGRSVESMRQGVLDVRRALAWLGSRPELAADKLGVTGISLGGIVSALAASIDPVVHRSAFLLAGGGLHDILWDMPEAEARRYRQSWLELGRTKADLQTLTTPYDPLTYAHRLKGKSILMIAGTTDEVIPPAAARSLWEAAGKPQMIWYDCGHYSAIGFLLPAIRRTVAFFAEDVPR